MSLVNMLRITEYPQGHGINTDNVGKFAKINEVS